jgi:hypothetical protein
MSYDNLSYSVTQNSVPYLMRNSVESAWHTEDMKISKNIRNSLSLSFREHLSQETLLVNKKGLNSGICH